MNAQLINLLKSLPIVMVVLVGELPNSGIIKIAVFYLLKV